MAEDSKDRSLPGARTCMDCDTPISACFGFVLASDFNAASDGALPWSHVRERCGFCVEKIAARHP